MPKFKDLKMAITYFKKLLKKSNFQLLFIKMSKFYQDLEIVMGGNRGLCECGGPDLSQPGLCKQPNTHKPLLRHLECQGFKEHNSKFSDLGV